MRQQNSRNTRYKATSRETLELFSTLCYPVNPMATNVEVTKNPNENPLSLLRRFTRRVQGSGILPRVRGERYHTRTLSHYKVKMKTLEKIERKNEIAELIKQGKMAPASERTRGR